MLMYWEKWQSTIYPNLRRRLNHGRYSANQPLRFWKDTQNLDSIVLDNSSAQTIYRGHALILDQNVDAIYAVLFDSNVTLATGDVILGIAWEPFTVLAADTETDNVIKYATWGSIPGFLMSQFGTFTDADMGDVVYLSDSGTLTVTAGSNLKIGVIHKVEDGYVYVRLTTPDQNA